MPTIRISKVAALALAVAVSPICSTGSLWAADKADTDKAKTLFGANCKSCHGVDGSGTPIGKSVNAPDLHSETVQKQTDAQLAEVISGGKGNMPNFKNILTPDEIHSLVRYVRQLGKVKPSEH